MIESLTRPDSWIIVIVLIGTVWYQRWCAVTDAKIQGFKIGAALGIRYGVKTSIEVLTTGKYLLVTEGNVPVYETDILIDEVFEVARNHLIKNPTSLTAPSD